jgi:uncharacterized protein YebE (UPF0316 family)
LTTDEILLVLLIFCLRAANNMLSTVRINTMTYGRRWLAVVLSFVESLIFAFTASVVLTNFDNVPNLLAYAGGFAVGGYFGMALEGKFITGYMTVNVITGDGGHDIALALRGDDFGVTETIGEGKEGQVTMLRSVIERQQIPDILATIRDINPDAFVTVEEARAVHQGWLRTRRLGLRR